LDTKIEPVQAICGWTFHVDHSISEDFKNHMTGTHGCNVKNLPVEKDNRTGHKDIKMSYKFPDDKDSFRPEITKWTEALSIAHCNEKCSAQAAAGLDDWVVADKAIQVLEFLQGISPRRCSIVPFSPWSLSTKYKLTNETHTGSRIYKNSSWPTSI